MTVVRVHGHWRKLPDGRRVWVREHMRNQNEVRAVKVLEYRLSGIGGTESKVLLRELGEESNGIKRIGVEVRQGAEKVYQELLIGEKELCAIRDEESSWWRENFDMWVHWRRLGLVGEDEVFTEEGFTRVNQELDRRIEASKWVYWLKTPRGSVVVNDKNAFRELVRWIKRGRMREVRVGDRVAVLNYDYVRDRIQVKSYTEIRRITDKGDGTIEVLLRRGVLGERGWEYGEGRIRVERGAMGAFSRTFFKAIGKIGEYALRREMLLLSQGIDPEESGLLAYTPELYERIRGVKLGSKEASALVDIYAKRAGIESHYAYVKDVFSEGEGYMRIVDMREAGEVQAWEREDELGVLLPGNREDLPVAVVMRERGHENGMVVADIATGEYSGGMLLMEQRFTGVKMPEATWERLKAQDKVAWMRLERWARLNTRIQELREEYELHTEGMTMPERVETRTEYETMFDLENYEAMTGALQKVMRAYHEGLVALDKWLGGNTLGLAYVKAREEMEEVISAIEDKVYGSDETKFYFADAEWTSANAIKLIFFSEENDCEFHFTVNTEEQWVYWDLMVIDSEKQGQGIGTRLKYQAEQALADWGIKRFYNLSDITVGRYAWAVMGYDFREPRLWIERGHAFLSALENKYGGDKQLWAKIEQDPFIGKLRHALKEHLDQERYIHSWEFAAWRAPNGDKFGKEFMLGQPNWLGMKEYGEHGWCIGCIYYRLKGIMKENKHCELCKELT